MPNTIQHILHILKGDKSEENSNLSRVIVRSSLYSFIAKAMTIVVGIITIPLVYNYLDKYQYGVFVTLTSIISWIDMFDFGIASGMRNKVTEARVDNNINKARQYISTSYVLLMIIAITVFLIYICFSSVINWQAVLNADDIDSGSINKMAFWVLVFFLVRFAASIINNVFFAFQKSYLVDVTQLIGKVVYLLSVIGMIYSNEITLFRVAVFQSAFAAAVPIIAAVYFFLKENDYTPSIKYVNFHILSDILGLGWQFFIIQIALLIIHSGNNLLISQFVDPSSVPAYAFSYQLFSYALLAYTIIITPLWSAYTEAWRSGNISWIQKTIIKMKKIFFLFATVCIVVVIISPWIFSIWIGPKADVPIVMSLAVAIMVLLDMWIRIYDYFINGVGKIRLQMIINISMAIINIPLAYAMALLLEMGAIGVVCASIVSYSVSAILSPIQAYKILNNTAKGIWNK